MRRLARIGLKDVKITTRDRSALLILLAMPSVLIFILNMAFGGQTGTYDPVPTVVVNKDSGRYGRLTTDLLTKNKDIRKITVVTPMSDEKQARVKVEAGDTAAVLIIPSDFTAQIEAAKPVTIQVLGDPGRQVSASIFAGIVQSIGSRFSAASITAQTTADVLQRSKLVTSPEQFAAAVAKAGEAGAQAEEASDVTVVVRGSKSEGEGIKWNPIDFYAAAQTALFLLFGSMFGAFAILAERNEHTLARMLTTPTTRTSFLGGKMLGIWIVGGLQFFVLLGFTTAIGASWGSWFGATLLGIGEAFAATGLAVLFVVIGKTDRAVGAIGPTVAILMGAFGGSWTPVFAMPDWMKPLHYLTPNGWALDGFFALQQGDPVSSILLNVVVLFGFGILYAAIGIPRLRWER